MKSSKAGWFQSLTVAHKCFVAFNATNDFNSSRDACKRAHDDADLLSINNAYEMLDIQATYPNFTLPFWVALTDDASEDWHWLSHGM